MFEHPVPRHGQRGVATMLVTLLLFLGGVLVLAYTNRGAIFEQRLAGSDMRARQAFAAANAGIDEALAKMQLNRAAAFADLNPLTRTFAGAQPTYYAARFCVDAAAADALVCPPSRVNALVAPAACAPPSGSTASVVSCGWSDDNSSVQRVVQVLSGTASTAGVAAAPLVARGAADLLTGGASIFNYFNDLTVWSGGSFLGQSNTGKTFTRDIGDPGHAYVDPTFNYRLSQNQNSPNCGSPPPGYSCSTQGSSFGHDAIFGDPTLANASDSDYFARFFGATPTSYRDTKATWVVDPSGTVASANSTDLNSVAGKDGQVVWVEGNFDLINLGTQDAPSILIVNGNLDLGSNVVFNGLIYVSGQVTGNGSPTIYGALIAAGGASANGNPKIIYDPSVLETLKNIGKAARVPGGFRDW